MSRLGLYVPLVLSKIEVLVWRCTDLVYLIMCISVSPIEESWSIHVDGWWVDKIKNGWQRNKIEYEVSMCVKRLCASLRNIISLRSFWMCLLLAVCSACYSDTSMPSAKTVANRVEYVNQIVSTLSQNIPNTSHITIKRLYTSITNNYIPTVFSDNLYNVWFNPKQAHIAGYPISGGGFSVNDITSAQMKSQLDAISKGSLRNWGKVLILLEVSTMLSSSQFESVITTFAKLAPSSALPAAARAHILSVMPK